MTVQYLPTFKAPVFWMKNKEIKRRIRPRFLQEDTEYKSHWNNAYNQSRAINR